MALRDRILNFQQVATATLATTATPNAMARRTVATVATVAVAGEKKIENQAAALPSWCRGDCSCLEVIEGLGPGCVRRLTAGPWREEWQRLNSFKACPGRGEIRATSYPCGKCGGHDYTGARGGWQCDGCNAFFEIIGGTGGPNIRQSTNQPKESRK